MLEKTLYSCNIEPISTDLNESAIECKYDNDNLTIGSTTVPRYNTEASSKVPNVLFYDLPQVILIDNFNLYIFVIENNTFIFST